MPRRIVGAFVILEFMIIVTTGNGKGKTTAALGQMVRLAGRGKRALMIQFIKGPWKSGEDFFAKQWKLPKTHFRIEKMGLGFVGILGDKLPRKNHKDAAKKALMFFRRELRSRRWDIIVLDEVNNAIQLKLLSQKEVLRAIAKVPIEMLVVCTGRDATAAMIKRGDLVSEVKEIKHPYNNGKIAKLGVEF